jgi:hypothetical protein
VVARRAGDSDQLGEQSDKGPHHRRDDHRAEDEHGYKTHCAPAVMANDGSCLGPFRISLLACHLASHFTSPGAAGRHSCSQLWWTRFRRPPERICSPPCGKLLSATAGRKAATVPAITVSPARLEQSPHGPADHALLSGIGPPNRAQTSLICAPKLM